MRVEKKTIVKEDGRLLTYYHFPESASAEEAAVFAAIPAKTAETLTEPPDRDPASEGTRV